MRRPGSESGGLTEADRDDAELLARYAAGDQGAARTLTRLHGPRVMALARRMLGDLAEAEEVTQEAMLRLWKFAPQWRPGEAAIGTWLYRVASNLCTDRLRQRRRHSDEEPPDVPDDRPSVEAQMIANDRHAALEVAVSNLPDRQRLALVLRHFEERGNPDIADIMGISVEAVESLLSRARRALAAELRTRAADLGYKTP